MTWRYRVVRHKTSEGADRLQIHSAYGNEDIASYPSTPQASTEQGLREDLTKMLAALDQPLVDYDDIKEE